MNQRSGFLPHRIVTMILGFALGCAILVGVVLQYSWQWTGTQYLILYWLARLFIFTPILFFGIFALLFPYKIYSIYLPFARSLSFLPLGSGQPANELQSNHITGIRIFGAWIALVALVMIVIITLSIVTHPYCLYVPCNVHGELIQ